MKPFSKYLLSPSRTGQQLQLTPPSECEICCFKSSAGVHFLSPSTLRPLDPRWLCFGCDGTGISLLVWAMTAGTSGSPTLSYLLLINMDPTAASVQLEPPMTPKGTWALQVWAAGLLRCKNPQFPPSLSKAVSHILCLLAAAVKYSEDICHLPVLCQCGICASPVAVPTSVF